MFCLFLICMDLSFTFNLSNLKTPLIRQSHRLSNKRGFTVFTIVLFKITKLKIGSKETVFLASCLSEHILRSYKFVW